MPTYTFFNKLTGVEYDKFMPIAEKEQYLKDHPNIEPVYTPIAIVGDHVMGAGRKVDSGFTENMQRIAEAHPNSPLADRYGSSKSSSKIKATEIAKKHGLVK